MFTNFHHEAARRRLGLWMAGLGVAATVAACGRPELALLTNGRLLEGQAVADALAASARVQLDSVPHGSGLAAHWVATEDARADLAIIQNDAYVPAADRSHLRTVAPLSTEYLLVVVRSELSASDLRELLPRRRVAVGESRSGTAHLFQSLAHHYGIDTSQVQWVYGPQEAQELGPAVDVLVKVTHLRDPQVRDLLARDRGQLFSLEEPEYALGGSAIEGFALTHPLVRPVLLPRFAVAGTAGDPTQTLAVDLVLVAHAKLSADVVRPLAEHLLRQVGTSGPDELAQRLQFPLHEGALQYLNRDQPTFWQENAEVIALLLTVLGLLYTGVRSLAFRRRRNERNRIEYWYAQLTDVETAHALGTDPIHLQERLAAIRRDALAELNAERLAADASFVIFLQLWNQVDRQVQAQAPAQGVSAT